MTIGINPLRTNMAGMRNTSAQDRVITTSQKPFRKAGIVVIMLLAVSTIIYLVLPRFIHLFSSDLTVSKEQLRFAKVARGDLQRDISVQGKIIAANSPTLFAPSSGTVSLKIKAGDTVIKGQTLAVITSPELINQLSQEESTYEQLAIEVGRHNIQIKSSLLNNQQTIELAAVNLEASEVEKLRAEMSIKNSLISKRELEEKVAAFRRELQNK